ncbi:MAG: hypothetical protein B6D55_05135 [Candidatus Omnitrophica bacterium 4484_70.2]|nr:MAG: hypothetical protein B6D55_05135 [Candidatus Omnitrophica bacterium 4484_70.2]
MERRTVNIILLVFFIGIFCVFSYFLHSKIEKIRKIRKEIKKIKKELIGFGNYREKLKSLEDEVSYWKSKVEKEKGYLFWKDDISLFVKEITKIAKILSIEFFSIDSHPSKKVATFPTLGISIEKMPLSISICENFSKLVEFLKRIENFDKFVKIEKMRIESGKEDIYHHQIRLMVSAFVLKKEKK